MRVLIAEADIGYLTVVFFFFFFHQVSTTDNGEDFLRIYHEEYNKVTSTTIQPNIFNHLMLLF